MPRNVFGSGQDDRLVRPAAWPRPRRPGDGHLPRPRSSRHRAVPRAPRPVEGGAPRDAVRAAAGTWSTDGGARGSRPTSVRCPPPQRNGRGVKHLDNDGIIPVLARAVREVETAVGRGSALASVRPRFQAIALLVRDERTRVKADTTCTEAYRAEQLKRLDGVATILAQTAARQSSLFLLLAEDAEISDETKALRREMLRAGGVEAPEPEPEPELEVGHARERQVRPRSVVSRQLATPFLRPDFSAVRPRAAPPTASRAGSCSARCSAPSRTPRRARRLLHGAARCAPLPPVACPVRRT